MSQSYFPSVFRILPAGILLRAAIPLALLATTVVILDIDPAEDAHIMFRYALNVAQGEGLVWNAGEKPVEGATEFLWTLLLVPGAWLGFDVGIWAQGLGLLFTAFTILLMLRIMLVRMEINVWIAIGAASLFAVGPIAVQALSGFGTPLFTFLMTLSWSLYHPLISRDSLEKRRAVQLLPVSLLLLSLTRPEGMIFSVLLIGAILAILDPASRRGLLASISLRLILPGLCYFLWRWNYFGWMLPNTFYAKQGGTLLHPAGVEPILRFFWTTVPLWTVWVLRLIYSGGREALRGVVTAAPVLLFPWFYLLIEQMQNIGFRFQYPVLPVCIIIFASSLQFFLSAGGRMDRKAFLKLFILFYFLGVILWIAPILGGSAFAPSLSGMVAILSVLVFRLLTFPALFPSMRESLRAGIIHFSVAVVIVGAGVDLATVALDKTDSVYDHRAQIGSALQPFSRDGYRMVTTEAGWLPFFSEWRAVDPFGLYDEHIAHHGLDTAYLDSLSPEIIMFRVYRDSYAPEWVPGDPRWNAMTQLLYRFAENREYVLAARVGVHHDCCWYYVKKDCPDAERIVSIISEQPGVPYTFPAGE